jgi:hypothetical protein
MALAKKIVVTALQESLRESLNPSKKNQLLGAKEVVIGYSNLRLID